MESLVVESESVNNEIGIIGSWKEEVVEVEIKKFLLLWNRVKSYRFLVLSNKII